MEVVEAIGVELDEDEEAAEEDDGLLPVLPGGLTQDEKHSGTEGDAVEQGEGLVGDRLGAEKFGPGGGFEDVKRLQGEVEVGVEFYAVAEEGGVPKPHGLAAELDVDDERQAEGGADEGGEQLPLHAGE